MKTRADLSRALRDILLRLHILEEGGKGHLYFQPPETTKMVYPAVVYALSGMPSQHADNRPYILRKRYSLTAIDKDPDSALPEELALLPSCRFDRFYTSDNLNHWVFTITI